MTGHRDPIEDWLSRDVEVLPPPPGSFQRVRRQARRRKAVQAASVAVGVAVIVAAGVSVPALTGNLFNGAGPAKLKSNPATAGTRTPTSRPTPAASLRPFPGTALADAGRGPAAARGFRPSSVTFVGYRGGTLGAVLGQAPCHGRLCTALAGTANYGTRWTEVSGPPAGSSEVSQVRFADAANGWAYGPALYATHDGGRHWATAAGVSGRVVDLATVGGRVLAVAAGGCAGHGSGCRYALYAAPAGGGPFGKVLTLPAGTQVVAGGLQLAGQRGYLITNGRLYAGPLSGAGWAAVSVSATSSGPACLTRPPAAGPRLLAPGRGTLYLACGNGAQLMLYQSADGGHTWRSRGRVTAAGTAASLALSPGGTLVLATTSGLYDDPPGARGWSPVAGGSASGVAFRYIGMTTAKLGVAVPATPAAGELFITTDGGRSWQARPISR